VDTLPPYKELDSNVPSYSGSSTSFPSEEASRGSGNGNSLPRNLTTNDLGTNKSSQLVNSNSSQFPES